MNFQFELLTFGLDTEYNDYFFYICLLRGRALFSVYFHGNHRDQKDHRITPTYGLDMLWVHIVER